MKKTGSKTHHKKGTAGLGLRPWAWSIRSVSSHGAEHAGSWMGRGFGVEEIPKNHQIEMREGKTRPSLLGL